MSAKAIMFVLGAALIIATPLFIRELAVVDAKQTELDTARATEREVELMLDTKKTALKARQISLDVQRKLRGPTASQAEDMRKLSQEIASLKSEREKLGRQLVDLVIKQREHAIGTELASLDVLTGPKLEHVVIRKVSDAEVSISHSQGAGRLTAADLPKELQDRFRLGIEATAVKPPPSPPPTAAVAAAPAQTPPGIQAPTGMPSTPVQLSPNIFLQPGATGASAGNQRAAAHIQLDIENAEKTIERLLDDKKQWGVRAEDLRKQGSNAQTAGRPSFNFYSQAAAADRAMANIDAQVGKLQQDILTFKKKLADTLTSGQ